MKKELIVTVALLALATAGCSEKPRETQSAAVPQAATQSQNNTLTSPPQQPAVFAHKGKVVATMDGGTYTFMQVEEKGKKIWLGAKQTKITMGDEVEYPESPFVEKFKSKALNRTFDKVYFVTQLRVNGK